MKDTLGDRMKQLEAMEAQRHFLPQLPVVARLDGKCFSEFTKDLKRPFDPRMTRAMIETTRYLVKETVACCGYTQSDEITLAWYPRGRENQIFFNGRIQKMCSVLASICSVRFNQLIAVLLSEKANECPVFDCRVWQLPTLEEATNAFLWRELDATKNSITMAAQVYYDHSELMNKNSSEKQEMLFRKGCNWNDFPSFFKRGTYVQKRIITSTMSPEELDQLPEKHHARRNPDLIVERTEYRELEMPPLTQVTNRVGVIFYAEEPTRS